MALPFDARKVRIGRHFYLLVNGKVYPHIAGADGETPDDPIAQLIELVNTAENAEALAGLDLAGARELRAALVAGFDAVADDGDLPKTDEVTAALTAVVAAISAVDGRIGELSTTEVEAQASIDALREQAHAGDDSATVGSESGEEAAEGAEGTEAGGEPAGDTAGTESEEAAGSEVVRVAAGAGRPSFEALRRNQPPAPVETAVEPAYRMVASAQFGPGARPGEVLDQKALGVELQRLHRSMQTLSPQGLDIEADGSRASVGGRKLVLGSIDIVDRPGVVRQEEGDASEIIDKAVALHAAHRDEEMRKVASGGVCVMAQPDYSINVVGERGTCFTDDLPTVVGMRPLAYYPYLKINQSNGATGPGSNVLATQGIDFVTAAQDAAGYGDPDLTDPEPGFIPVGGSAYKSCVHIDCPPEPLTCDIEAVYKCVTIGNFQARSHPEYVNAFQTYMDIWLDIERDNRALNSFVAKATAQSHLLTTGAIDKAFGAVLSLRDLFHRLLAKERSARHSPNLSFNVVAPEWFGGFLALDVMRHAFGSLDNLRATPSQALALASTDGIRISTYCTETSPTGTPVRQVLTPIGTSAVPAWPVKARLLMYADGAVFKKTQGSLEFGLRETLMKTNDFGMFMEVFEIPCYRDDVYVFDVELCPNGATGAPLAVTC